MQVTFDLHFNLPKPTTAETGSIQIRSIVEIIFVVSNKRIKVGQLVGIIRHE